MSKPNPFPCPVQGQESAGLLLEYLDRQLEPELAARIERHIAQCGDCQSVAAAQAAVWDALDRWEPAPVSADFDERLFARIESERLRPAGFWSRLRSAWSGPLDALFRPAVPVAAACALLVGVFFFRPAAEVPVAAPAVQAESIDMEQVEKTLADVDVLRQLEGSLADGDLPASQAL